MNRGYNLLIFATGYLFDQLSELSSMSYHYERVADTFDILTLLKHLSMSCFFNLLLLQDLPIEYIVRPKEAKKAILWQKFKCKELD